MNLWTRHQRGHPLAIAAIIAALFTACGTPSQSSSIDSGATVPATSGPTASSAAAPSAPPAASPAQTASPERSLEPTAGSSLPQGAEEVNLDPAEFSAVIDHPYWPMAPGTRWTYRETGPDGEVRDVVIVATDQTKRIANGVTARVVRDTVRQDEEIIEDTFDWYAQDREGNLWYLGEDTAEFEGGKVSSTGGSFEAGVDGALPGIILPAEAVPGLRYRQEYYRGEAEDNGEVLSLNEMVDVEKGHFADAILTK
nr:hypothetical protein [Chloroflexota bacterium]